MRVWVHITITGLFIILSCAEMEPSREDQVEDYIQDHPMTCFGSSLFEACPVESLDLQIEEEWRYDRSLSRIECWFEDMELVSCECLNPREYASQDESEGELVWMNLEVCLLKNR